ncbi:MAG: DUF2808 domain-containing protein [Aphanocapsa lilacina HA4352-LM1]|jgi:hypothetical protein|nr:DUF2808 domain-containing protein [Aphanocapsa lilacina HA4352-LM1]
MLKAFVAGLVGVMLVLPAAVLAGVAGGETFFERFPTLARAATDNNSSTYNFARYSFDVVVPTDSGEGLGSLFIGIPNGIRPPTPDMVQAFNGNGDPVAVQSSVQGNAVQVTFAQPVGPGNRVSVQFYPMRNPRRGGTFLFDVNAAPAGPSPRAQFLSYGRISFYTPGGRGH